MDCRQTLPWDYFRLAHYSSTAARAANRRFAIAYVPSKLLVAGNATATANNIATHELFFRLGIAANLICQTLFIFVAFALYNLFKGINQRHAVLMVTMLVISVPIAFLNELNAIAALVLVRGTDFLSLPSK